MRVRLLDCHKEVDIMNASDLKGRAVVTLSDANKIGHVSDVLFDPQYRHVLGFRVRRSRLGGTDAVLRASVSAIGTDALTIAGPDAVNAEKRFSELTNAVDLDQATHTSVVSESGNVVGSIANLELDDEARTMTAYELDAPLLDRLRGRRRVIKVEDVLRVGSGGIMMIPTSVSDELSAAHQ